MELITSEVENRRGAIVLDRRFLHFLLICIIVHCRMEPSKCSKRHCGKRGMELSRLKDASGPRLQTIGPNFGGFFFNLFEKYVNKYYHVQ